MKYTYSKMIKDCEKLVKEKGLEVHAVKWLFHSSDLFCGYSHLNDEVNEEVKETYNYNSDVEVKSSENLINKESIGYIHEDKSNEEKIRSTYIDVKNGSYWDYVIDYFPSIEENGDKLYT